MSAVPEALDYSVNVSTSSSLKDLLTDELLDATDLLMVYIDKNGSHCVVSLGDVCAKFDQTTGLSKRWRKFQKTKLQCSHCNFTALTTGEVFIHEQRYHSFINQALDASASSDVGTDRTWMRNLKNDNSSFPVYQCDQCNFKSLYRHNVLSHQLSDHRQSDIEETAKEIETNKRRKTETRTTNSELVINYKPNVTTYECDFCQETFGHIKLKTLHMENHHLGTGNTYECPLCKDIIPKELWTDHRKLHGGLDNRLQCENCNKLFKSFRNLIKHCEEVHRGLKFSCKFCGTSYSRKSSLRDHTCKASIEIDDCLEHLCDICGCVYRRKTSLIKHIKAKHPDLEKTLIISDEDSDIITDGKDNT